MINMGHFLLTDFFTDWNSLRYVCPQETGFNNLVFLNPYDHWSMRLWSIYIILSFKLHMKTILEPIFDFLNWLQPPINPFFQKLLFLASSKNGGFSLVLVYSESVEAKTTSLSYSKPYMYGKLTKFAIQIKDSNSYSEIGKWTKCWLQRYFVSCLT